MRNRLCLLAATSLTISVLAVAGPPGVAAQQAGPPGLAGAHVLRDDAGRATSLLPDDGVLAPARAGSRGNAALHFLRSHASLYAMSAADVATFRVDETITDPSGVTYVTLAQRSQGLPVDRSPLKFTFDKQGRLVFANGVYARGLDASTAGTDAVSAGAAVQRALKASGVRSDRAPAEKGRADGVVRFENTTTELAPIEHTAEKVVFPVEGGKDQIAWRTYVEDENGESFKVVVDASSGEVLQRRTQQSHSGPEGRVFTGEHPNESGPRTVVPFTGVNGTWVTDRTTTGNNTDTYEDRDEDDVADANGRPITPENGQPGYQHFDYAFTDDWRNNGGTGDVNATVTQLFYYTNVMHDRLYNLGFTEAWKNFQEDNFGNGGTGSDRVLAEARDGWGTGVEKLCERDGVDIFCRNNANFNTRPEGTESRMQMYFFDNPNRDGSLDGDVIAHEYGHGISGRLIANANLNDTNEAGSLGEGFGDTVSMMLWDDPIIGEFVTNDLVNGIRNFSYANSNDDYANYSTTGGVHDQGEIWATVMWRSLVALRGRYDNGPGLTKFQQTVVAGMKNLANPPTMPSARDAFIAALRTLNGGSKVDDCLVWVPFARIGLGANATGGGGENYTIPAACVPTAKLVSPVSTSEGTDVQLDASGSTLGSDDTASTLSYAWDLDNDGEFDDATGAKPTFTDVGRDGAKTVRVQVTSSTGAQATASGTVNVTNVAPVVSGALSGSTSEGAVVSLNGTISDAGWLDPLTGTVDWGDGAGPVPLSGTEEHVRPNGTLTFDATHRYGDNGAYTVTVCGSDDDTTTCVDKPFTVVNVAPSVTLEPLGPIVEGGSIQIKGSFSDPGWLDTHSAFIDPGDGLGERSVPITKVEGGPGVPDTGTFSLTVPYGDNGSFAVKARVTDDDGGTGLANGTVNVSNVNPTLTIDLSGATIINGQPVIVTDVNSTVPFSSRVTDPGSDDLTHTWDWGDGGASPDQTDVSLVNPPNPDPANSPSVQPRDVTFNATHQFPLACTYEITSAVKDDDGGTDSEKATVMVIDDHRYAQNEFWWFGQYNFPGQRPLAFNDETDEQLLCYLKTVRLFSQRFSLVRPVNTLKQAAAILQPPLLTPYLNARNQLDATTLAAWLDIADGSLKADQPVDTGLDLQVDTTLIELLRKAEAAAANPNSTILQLLALKLEIEEEILLDTVREAAKDLLP